MNNLKLTKDDLNNIIEEKCPHTGNVLTRYSKGRRLGKGGFAVCHEVINLKTNKKSAVKIIDKTTLTKSKAKEKLASEIKIHSEIKSEYVVKFEHFFEDAQFVYIILELCPNQTLNELIKRRKRLTELEVKYYMHQLITATKDIHEQNVIHRDLKLGNLLLTERLEIRVGDFGLAAKVVSKHQRRKTMCGTPNYIAPEILDNLNGHSFEVDIWSLGVIAYALAIGRPPFETSDVKTTYTKIKNCNYSYPDDANVSECTKSFISKMLQRDPRHRATVEELLNDEFFIMSPFPKTLPISALACPPNGAFLKQYQLPVMMKKNSSDMETTVENDTDGMRTERGLSRIASRRTIMRANSTDKIENNQVKRAASTAVLMGNNKPSIQKVETKLNQRNRYGPFIWIVYFEENPKFGMSYMLNSNAIGMRYNDSTSLISNHEFNQFKYFDSLSYKQNPRAREEIFSEETIPQELSKKYKIIDYYKNQLKNKKTEDENKMCNEQLIQKEKLRFRETQENMMQVFVVKYYKNSNVTIFWFNNKDSQVIFKDSTELLFSKNHVTYVNKVGNRKYFEKENVDSEPEEIKKRMRYSDQVIDALKNAIHNDVSNKENKPANEGSMQRRDSASLSSQQESLKMMRSSSMQRIEKVDKTKNILMMKGSASTNRLSTFRFQ